ncbi:hypothetical protein [Antarctobacter heliothermus]|uniref:Uncharacterized protein n=1 Tax=Antarctobacter heliothermus TaxID=74033 RepID=A0A239KZC2_9RHOB|nr:hypothetical protein [Antarctobacter heliothermus]SNT23405.1 hypothetical protein SAMN04488078_107517 [Antarctobacter heliothermus]
MLQGVRPAHKVVSRALEFYLTLGVNGKRSDELVTIFSARLTEDEKAGIAYAALLSMEDQNAAYQIGSIALFGVYRGEVVG